MTKKALSLTDPAYAVNEEGLTLYILRLCRRITRLNPALDTPAKIVAALKNTGTPVFNQAQLNREFHRFLAHIIMWSEGGGRGPDEGEGIGIEATDDGGTA